MIEDIEDIALKINQLKSKVELNFNSEKNPDAPLKFAQKDYLKCFTVDVDSFRNFLDQDVELWK